MPYIESIVSRNVNTAAKAEQGIQTPPPNDMNANGAASDTEMTDSSADEETKTVVDALVSLKQCVTDLVHSKVHDTSEAGTTSRPPSPPESGTTTPRLRIATCPSRLSPLIPPPNYGTVDHNRIYRSSFPQDRNIEFIKSLHIRSVLTLVSSAPTSGYTEWTSSNSINQRTIDIAPNKEGRVSTTQSSLCEALLFMLDRENQPLYIHCNQGRHRTGCVVACLRRVQRWPLAAIIDEYVTYASPKARPGDIALIEAFDPNVVFEHAKLNGYLDGPAPRLRRLDSGITNIDALAAALASAPIKAVMTEQQEIDTELLALVKAQSVDSDDGLVMMDIS